MDSENNETKFKSLKEIIDMMQNPNLNFENFQKINEGMKKYFSTETGRDEIESHIKELISPEIDKIITETYAKSVYSVIPMDILKECVGCKKESVLVGYFVDPDNGDMCSAGFCSDCFKQEFPEYTLDNSCILCSKKDDCDVQRLLFNPKEIEEFRNKLILDSKDLEMI